jgi:hypothetical protein
LDITDGTLYPSSFALVVTTLNIEIIILINIIVHAVKAI